MCIHLYRQRKKASKFEPCSTFSQTTNLTCFAIKTIVFHPNCIDLLSVYCCKQILSERLCFHLQQSSSSIFFNKYCFFNKCFPFLYCFWRKWCWWSVREENITHHIQTSTWRWEKKISTERSVSRAFAVFRICDHVCFSSSHLSDYLPCQMNIT